MVEDDASDFEEISTEQILSHPEESASEDDSVNPILNQFPDQDAAQEEPAQDEPEPEEPENNEDEPEEDSVAAEFDEAMSDEVESFDFGEEDEF